MKIESHTMLIKNNYYPNGLTSNDVIKYYQKNKGLLIKENFGRDVMLWIMTELNKGVMKRKGINDNYLQLTNTSYDKLMHGRTICVYSVMKFYEDIGIVDIDCNNLEACKEATSDVYESILDASFINKAYIKFTGKTGFHVVCELNRKAKIDAIRFLLKNHLSKDPNLKKYTMQKTRTVGTPNIDLSPNKLNGAFISIHSLSQIGLRCQIIDYTKLKSFNPNIAKI